MGKKNTVHQIYIPCCRILLMITVFILINCIRSRSPLSMSRLCYVSTLFYSIIFCFALLEHLSGHFHLLFIRSFLLHFASVSIWIFFLLIRIVFIVLAAVSVSSCSALFAVIAWVLCLLCKYFRAQRAWLQATLQNQWHAKYFHENFVHYNVFWLLIA